MANNWQIDMIAGLDPNQSRAKINSQINKLKGQLKDVSLTAKIDPKIASDIQKQLTNLQVSLTNVKISDKALNDMVSQINNALQGIKIPNINIGGNGNQQFVNNITSGFKQSANAIESFKNSLSNAGKSSSEIDNIVKKVQALNVQIDSLRFSESTNGSMNVNVAGLDEFGNKVRITQTLLQDLQTMQWNVSNTTTSIVSTKELERINNTFTDYTAKLAQFKSTNTNILSGLTQPLADFESKLAGLKNGTVSIDEVKNAFKLLGTEASKITENFTGQLSKTDAAIRKLAQGDEIMDKLKASFKGLNNAPKEINKELASVSKLLQNVKKIESTEGRTANWSAEYRKWSDEVDKLQAKLSVFQKQQANMTTPQIFKTSELRDAGVAYMTKVSNTINKQMPELQKMLNAHNWNLTDIKGIEDTDGKIKSLTLTVRDAEGALKQFVMQRAKLETGKNTPNGLMQVGDVKILETASQAQEKLAQSTEKVNAKLSEQANKIQLSMGVNGDTTSQIDILRNNFTKLGLSADEVKTKMSGVDTEVKTLQSLMNSGADNSAIVTQFEKLQTVLTQTQNNLKQTRSDYSLLATEQQRLSLANTIEAWNQKNTRATKEVRAENDRYVASLRDLNTQMTKLQFGQIQTGFKQAENSMRTLNRLGLAFKDQWTQAINSFKVWLSATTLVMTLVNKLRQIPTSVKELDTALVDLKKTTSMTASQLEEFYYTANDVAKQMGVTTKEIIDQASAWSRLGYSSQEAATKMAKLSSQFKLISPGMTSEEAVSGLVSIMKAYGIEVEDVLDGIMSKVNVVGNKFALSNSNIINMLQDSVSAMAEGNNTLEETIALETAAFEITQDENVGNGFKTVALRLRGINEETEELDDSLKTISGDLYDLTGVSVMQDADTFKSTYQILKEVSEIWDSLSDKTQADALELMFGKHRANIGSAVISNFDAAKKAMDEMANSAGNANAELVIAMDSIEHKANKTKEIGTGIAQNLLKREDMKTVLDTINSLGEGLDWLTEKLGLFGTSALIGGGILGAKNAG